MIRSLKTNHFKAVVDLLTTEQESELKAAELECAAIISKLCTIALAQPMSLQDIRVKVAMTGKSILHSTANGMLLLTYPEQSKIKQGSLLSLMIKEPQLYETFEKTLNHLHKLGVNLCNAIHSAQTIAEFGVILRDYTPEQMMQIPQEINRLAGLINTQDDLRRVLRNLNPKQINIFYAMLREHISRVTDSIEKYANILGRLETEQIGALIESSIEHLSALIKTADDYHKICGHLTNQQKIWFASTLKSQNHHHTMAPELLAKISHSVEQAEGPPRPEVNVHVFFSLPQELAPPPPSLPEITADEHTSTDIPGRKRSSSH
jgi:hypothetical protein